MTIRYADNGLFKVTIFEAHGAQHRAVGGAGDAGGDELRTFVKFCHLDLLPWRPDGEARRPSKAVRAARQRPAEIKNAPTPILSGKRPNTSGGKAWGGPAGAPGS